MAAGLLPCAIDGSQGSQRTPVNRPTMFDQAVPPLSRLLALCVEGEREAACAPLQRYRAANPADPLAELLLRFLAAAASNEWAVLQAIES